MRRLTACSAYGEQMFPNWQFRCPGVDITENSFFAFRVDIESETPRRLLQPQIAWWQRRLPLQLPISSCCVPDSSSGAGAGMLRLRAAGAAVMLSAYRCLWAKLLEAKAEGSPGNCRAAPGFGTSSKQRFRSDEPTHSPMQLAELELLCSPCSHAQPCVPSAVRLQPLVLFAVCFCAERLLRELWGKQGCRALGRSRQIPTAALIP